MLVPKVLADPQLCMQHASWAGLRCSKQRQVLRCEVQCSVSVLNACLVHNICVKSSTPLVAA